jgi:putative NADPH-quinone reductase/1,4-dihydroxy-2-naphthoate octaprenyltransferase
MKVLIIVGHPREDSFCGALARVYAEGARAAGAEVRELTLAAMDFDPHVRYPSPCTQTQEPDIVQAREWITWADHLVFVYPTWWGTMPALLKGFLDRTLTPGFAFVDREEGGWEQRLTGKSAHLLTTMDTPGWVYRAIYGAPGHKALARATLGFCGVSPVRVHSFGPVKDSRLERRALWLEQARREGAKLRGGVLTPAERLGRRLSVWLTALRLQFYPMTWVAYTTGAFAAAPTGLFSHPSYWLGYLCLFLIEVATVLANELFDYETDRRNRHYGPFNGGSRVLISGLLRFAQVRRGIAVVLLFVALTAVLLLETAPAVTATAVLITVGIFLGLGYTMPPFRLVYRGMGEITVGLTHGILAVLCGFVFQGGDWNHPLPWLLGIPLFLSILPSIILAGIPDYEADQATGKKTLAVRLGTRRAVSLAMAFTGLSAAMILNLPGRNAGHDAMWRGVPFFVVPHAILLVTRLYRYRQQARPPGRIDGLMVLALTYHTWFGLLPLINQWRHSAAP